ncbi:MULTISPECIES: hypothetical protein [unclassified Moorena]|uniref:hypothetical protein n=1 Tax=unclassified Moorena TaxID=2683338 RepID=UPI0013FEBAB3|nr:MULTISPECIES: hypothetical protein [unclassified Moorena]NEO15009.1 hypothetical protein [Moorena sp. SIO3E8]NEQ01413.1 hypothetical protein [Moorena sp. SIO3F7]
MLADLVKVEQPIEVGTDFVARAHHSYHTSTSTYVDAEYPPKAPEQREQMCSILRGEMGQSNDPKDAIIEAILARSLLEPTGKTYFKDSERKFIIVEPKLTREDIERWATLSTSTS